jgi:predicted nucleic acid-binding protein
MIVDTNALSAYLDGDPEIEPVFLQASNVTLSSVVLGEYRFGILRSKKNLVLGCVIEDFRAGRQLNQKGPGLGKSRQNLLAWHQK